MPVENKTPKATASFPSLSRAVFLAALVSCATVPDGPLGFRILPVEKRYEFLQDEHSDISPEIRNAFMEGEVVPGMPRDWVLQLYGRPDRITDRSWEYFDDKGEPVLEISFERDYVDSVQARIRPR
jgi:hypothetical protein